MVYLDFMWLILDEILNVLQDGCFRYFELGGRCIDDPVGLLSGYLTSWIVLISRIYARPILLVIHFYAVALYSIFLLFRKASIVNYPSTVIKGFNVLAKACVVLIPVVISELLP
jgi:squalene monooxygenase